MGLLKKAAKKVGQAAASPIKAVGWTAKKVGQSEITKDVFGNSIASGLARTGEGVQEIAREKPGLALAAMATGGTGLGIMAGLGAIQGYKSSQADQATKAALQGERAATEEFQAMNKAEEDKTLQARLKARQEEIMLRSGQTQKNIFGTGAKQQGILG